MTAMRICMAGLRAQSSLIYLQNPNVAKQLKGAQWPTTKKKGTVRSRPGVLRGMMGPETPASMTTCVALTATREDEKIVGKVLVCILTTTRSRSLMLDPLKHDWNRVDVESDIRHWAIKHCAPQCTTIQCCTGSWGKQGTDEVADARDWLTVGTRGRNEAFARKLGLLATHASCHDRIASTRWSRASPGSELQSLGNYHNPLI